MINIEQAVEYIQQGEVIAYPTEAVFGLGCDPSNEQAFLKLLAIKQRPIEKGVILIASTVEQVLPWAKLLNENWTDTVLASWQATEQPIKGIKPITWILPAQPNTPKWLTGGRDTIAVRISQHSTVVQLCNALNSAVVSTSANLFQQPAITSAEVCQKIFPNIPILSGQTQGLSAPSQIWSAKTLKQIR